MRSWSRPLEAISAKTPAAQSSCLPRRNGSPASRGCRKKMQIDKRGRWPRNSTEARTADHVGSHARNGEFRSRLCPREAGSRFVQANVGSCEGLGVAELSHPCEEKRPKARRN